MRSLTSLVLLVVICVAVSMVAAVAEQGKRKGPLLVPAAEKDRDNPRNASAESLGRGKTLFQSQCAMCHGETGAGDGALTEQYGFECVDFTDAEHQKSRTDGEYFYIMTQGCGHMPGEGERLPALWKWDLVNHIRSLETTQ